MAVEYRTLHASITSSDDAFIFDLQRLDEDGWTVVSAQYVPGQWTALLKRNKPGPT